MLLTANFREKLFWWNQTIVYEKGYYMSWFEWACEEVSHMLYMSGLILNKKQINPLQYPEYEDQKC